MLDKRQEENRLFCRKIALELMTDLMKIYKINKDKDLLARIKYLGEISQSLSKQQSNGTAL